MPIFDYVGTDKHGKPIRGNLHGRSLQAAAQDLAGQGIEVQVLQAQDDLQSQVLAPPVAPPTRVRQQIQTSVPIPDIKVAPTKRVYGGVLAAVPLAALAFFYRQLASMLHAGVGMVESLETLSTQSMSGKVSQVAQEMAHNARTGKPISEVMERHNEVFSPMALNVIRAGEMGGFLDRSLVQMADYTDREIALRNVYRRVSFYPKVMVAMAIIILSAANLIIKIVAPDSPVKLKQPLLTPTAGIALLIIIAAFYLFRLLGVSNPGFRYIRDSVVMRIPWLGRSTRQFAMAKFGRALGLLYKSGVPAHVGFRLSAESCGNEYMAHHLAPASDLLAKGMGLTAAFSSTRSFDPVVMSMVSTGERTGNLDQMMESLATHYEEEAATRSTQIAWFMGVMLLLTVALYIAYVYATNFLEIMGPLKQIAKEAAEG